MKIIIAYKLFVGVVFLLTTISTSGQFPTSINNDTVNYQKTNPLSIGDYVPEEIWNQIPGANSANLIILDFWSVYCTPCIYGFPKMEKLQSAFNKDIQIVLVNCWQDQEIANQHLSKINKSKLKDQQIRLSLPSLFEDSYQKLFPHVSVPHHVWINSKGKVLAITDYRSTNEENIRSVLKGDKVLLPLKVDFFPNKPMYLGDTENDLSQFEHFALFKKGEIENAEPIVRSRRSINDEVIGYAMRNVSLLDIYMTAVNGILGRESQLSGKQFIFTADLSSLLECPETHDSVQRSIWRKDNLYTLDLVEALENLKSNEKYLFESMLSTLNSKSSVFGEFKKIKTRCLVLKMKNHNQVLLGKPGKGSVQVRNDSLIVMNGSVNDMVAILNLKTTRNIPYIFNGTSLNQKINISMSLAVKTTNELMRALEGYGFSIIEEERELSVFIIKSKTK